MIHPEKKTGQRSMRTNMQRRLSSRMTKSRRAFSEARRRSVPLKVLIPNIVTILGLCAGLTGIRFAIERQLELALLAIGVAAALDGVDGRMARLLKASSRFGAELDSLADFVSFGVAPSIILYQWGFSDYHSLGWILVLVFSIAAALRLARFNVALDVPAKPLWQSAFFVGMPVPAGAIGLMWPLYLEQIGISKDYVAVPGVLAAYALFVAFLMVSRIPTFSGKQFGRRIQREYIAPVIAITAVAAILLVTYPFHILSIICAAYLILIPISIRQYKLLEKANAASTSVSTVPTNDNTNSKSESSE
jgi:CDP-diacylglycerol--serine O-phosphatidyltransferase